MSAWSPWLEKDAEIMEKVQQRAIRAMTDVRGNSYEERLKKNRTDDPEGEKSPGGSHRDV